MLVSCTLVAYGFARFRFPGRTLLFTVADLDHLPAIVVTIIPTYLIWVKLGIVGSSTSLVPWLPLLVPAFLANAFDVFLLRQYFMTMPRELDEAAAIDGAGPLRILISMILPQAWPAIIAVGIFSFVYSWNDFFEPLIYLSGPEPNYSRCPLACTLPGHPQPRAVVLQAGTAHDPGHSGCGVLIFQRVFTRGIVITGVEK